MERGGGFLLAAGLLLGAVLGIALGQGTIGLLGGAAVGLAAALGYNWYDSRGRRGDD